MVLVVLCVTTVAEVLGAASSQQEWRSSPKSKGWLRFYLRGVPYYSFETKTGSVKRYNPKTKRWSAVPPAAVPRVVRDKMETRGLVPLEDSPTSKGWRRTQIRGTEWSFNLEKGTINRKEKSEFGKYEWKMVPASKAPKELLTAMKTVGVKLQALSKPRTTASVRRSIFPQHVLDRHRRIGSQSPTETLGYLKTNCAQRFLMSSETGKRDQYLVQSIEYDSTGHLILKRDYLGISTTERIPLAKMDPTRNAYRHYPFRKYLLREGGLLKSERWETIHAHHMLRITATEGKAVVASRIGNPPKGDPINKDDFELYFAEQHTAQVVNEALVHFIKLHGGKGELFRPTPIRRR